MNTNIGLEEGWAIIQNQITKLINIIEGVPESPMDGSMYTTVYNLCTQKPLNSPTVFNIKGKFDTSKRCEPVINNKKELYERYQGIYNDYLSSTVLPAIQEKHDDITMLQELVKRWENYKVLVGKLCRSFNFLDRYYIASRELPTLKDVGFGCFRKIVGAEIKVRVKDAVIRLIKQEREGEEIDQTLVKNILEIFVDLGNESDTQNMEYYVNDFETAFLNDTTDYYTWKASDWTPEEYALKGEESLQREKDRVYHYLHPSTEEKLLKTVQDVLNTVQTIA